MRHATSPRSAAPERIEAETLRITFVTDIVTPYWNAIFTALAAMSELRVVYCSVNGTRGMPWAMAGGPSFEHEIVDGVRLPAHTGGTDYHLDPRILRAIARGRPDVVVSGGYSFPTLYASLYCAAFRRQLVIQEDGTARTERRIGHVQKLARKILLPRAATCAANSPLAAQRFQELGVQPARIFLAPHSTDLERHWRAGRERTYEPTDVVRVLATGRLIPGKGLDRLLHATAIAIKSGAALELRLVGGGPEQERLSRLAADLGIAGAVKFPGFVDQEHLPLEYEQADVYVFPTLRDTYGIVLLEAAAAGLPLMASPEAGATQDLVQDGVNGLVVHPDDIPTMADTLVRLARDPGLRERLGRAAHESSLPRTPQAAAQGYVDAARAALGRAPA